MTQLTYREKEEENFIQALIAAKAANTIAEAMNKFKNDTDVQHHGCGAFMNLLFAKQKSAAKAALDAGAIKLATLAMKQHPDVECVQQNALLCLQNAIIVTDVNLAAKANSAVLLKEKDDDDDCIIALALQAMEKHSDVLGVQRAALDFLSALVLHNDDHGVKERILENDGDVTIAKLFTLRHQYDDGNDDDDDDDDSDNLSSNIAKDAANLLAKLF
jgi:hypothetical protein